MKEIIVFFVGFVIGGWAQESQAQNYVVTNPQGLVQQTVQVRNNQAQVVNNQGYVTETLTIYQNQVVSPSGSALGVSTGYTVPSVPMSPSSPRVMQ